MGIVKMASAQRMGGRRGLSAVRFLSAAAAVLSGAVVLTSVATVRAAEPPATGPAVPPPAPTAPAPAPAPSVQPAPAPNVVTPGVPAGQALVTGGLDERTGSVRLLVNKSTTLITSRPYKRISVGQPDIAEVNGIGPTRILVTGKKAGATQIIVWDEDDNSQQIDVLVQANLLALRSLYERLLPGSQIDVIDNDGTIALTGQVPNLATADQAAALASGYGNKVLNLLEVAGGQQVMLQVRFAEVSKTAISQLGVNIGYSDGNSFVGSNIGNSGNFSVRALQGNQDASDLGIVETAADTIFGRAVFRDINFIFFIKALRENNLLRVLAEPNLVATSGQEAEFLAGGDFPIPIVQGGSDQGTSITVEYKEFGVRLKFTPVVLGTGRIRLKMAPEVSDVDFTNAVISQGFRIPGRRTRRLSTTVEINEGETFAVGGLLDNRVASNKAATPLLGDVPILGALFRSVRYQRQETELIVLVTPRIVSGLQPGQVHKVPGEHWRHPNEMGMFLFGDIGDVKPTDEEAEKIPARRFIGRYGFVPAPQ